MKKLDKKCIPKGYYCYSGSCMPGSKTFKPCPYWTKVVGKPEQENGFCKYLGKGDYEINREAKRVTCSIRQEDGSWKEKKIKYGPKNPSFMSLLWDQVKDFDCPVE